jgi:hypothetical protein
LGGVLVVLGVGGYFAASRLFGAEAAPPATATAGTLTPEPTAKKADVPPTAKSAETTVAPITAPPTEVRLHLETTPPGATVSKGGFQVCQATPCDITVSRNEGIELEARKGAMRGTSKLLPQNDQTVSIALAAPVAKPKPEAPAAPAGHVRDDDRGHQGPQAVQAVA